MSRRLRRLLVTVVILGGVVALGWHLTRPQPVAVIARPAEVGRVESTVANTRSGTVKACRRAKLAVPVSGEVVSLPVREGQRVKKGDLLLQLWNEDLAARLKLAEREALAAQAKAEEACRRAQLARDEAKRLTSVDQQGVYPEDVVERAVADAEASAASCRAAEASAKVSAAQVEVARAALDRTFLRAPFDGIVADINTELGEVVIPSPPGIPTLPAIDLIEEGCLYVRAPLDEVDAPQVRVGMEATVTLDALPDRTFKGRVQRIAPFVLDREKEARTVDVDVELVNPGENAYLLPGYSADIEVLLESRDGVLRVPTEAILEGPRVLVFRESRLEERKIKTGLWNWRYSEVLSGLEAGDLVVTSLDREGLEAGAAAVLDEAEEAGAPGKPGERELPERPGKPDKAAAPEEADAPEKPAASATEATESS